MRINIPVTPEMEEYIDRFGYREHDALHACRREAATRGEMAVMQVAPEQGALLQVLLKAIRARKVLEIGTFTGYSAMAMAMALPEDGQVVTVDVDADIIKVAQSFWTQGGVDGKIAVRLGEAETIMRGLLDEGHAASFDLILIDADKPRYPGYFRLAADLVRPGGLLVLDDSLIHGRVVTGPLAGDPDFVAPAVDGMRAVNAMLAQDERFTFALLPTRDGLSIAVRH